MREIDINKLKGKTLCVEMSNRFYKTTFYTDVYVQTLTNMIGLRLDNGEPFAVLTCCIPGVELEENEILVKTWSENEAVAKAALDSGLFEDTGKRISTGFVSAQVWRVK